MPLSEPSARQAEENAQVLQNVTSSPSSAIGLTRRAAPTALIARRSQRRSDRFREARWLFGWLLEIAIEAHRYDTHQQPSARGGLDEARPHLDQPIGLQRRQPRQGVGEIAQEIDRSEEHTSELQSLL